jgi:hypothetical protein
MYPTKEQIQSEFYFDLFYGVFIPIKEGGTAPRINADGYLVIQVRGRPYLAHRCAWVIINGSEVVGPIDHKNGIRSDNLPCNLRPASPSQNAMNRKTNSRNSSGYKGVSWERREGRWKAEIRKGKKRIFRKFFDRIEDAASAIKDARTKLHGEFARHE